MSCQQDNEDTTLEGLVQRVEPKPQVKNSLQTVTPREKAALYAREGFWQDALTTLGELRRSKPQDTALTSDWQQLLESVGLEDISKQPISQCCKL